MNAKLTLRLDQQLIQEAKAHARVSGKSLSQVVAEYFRLLGREHGEGPCSDISPRVALLRGSLKASAVDEGDYRRYLEEKHR